jgi:hypothetical protein
MAGPSAVRSMRAPREPEAHEQRQSFVRDGNMAFKPLDLTRQTIEPTAERRFHSFGIVWRQIR